MKISKMQKMIVMSNGRSSRLRGANGTVRFGKRFSEKGLIDLLSQDEKIALYQYIEVDQGIRISNGKLPALSPNAKKILLRYMYMPPQRKSRYAESVKTALFHSTINAIKTD